MTVVAWIRRVTVALAWLCSTLAYGAGAPARVSHLELNVSLDPQTRRFEAVAEVLAPPGYRFRLHESLDVRSVQLDGREAAITPPTGASGLREWRLPNKNAARLRLEYAGTLPPLDRELDHRGVLRITAPMAGPDGSFLAAGRGWYPEPAGLFTYVVDISLPPGQRGLVAGRLVQETVHPDKRYSARFEFVRGTDGIDLMAGPYVIRERVVTRYADGPLRLRTYFPAALDHLANDYLEDSRRYIELYSARIGGYPYTEFSVVASPLPTGFGMPTLTYLGADVLKLPFIRATSLGHEVLHNWWGNGVYPDYGSGNWSEGLTTYMADYFYKERESAAAARDMRIGWLRDFAAVAEERQEPLTAFRARTHGAAAAVGYGKAAMLFQMLKSEIGEAAFERGLRGFWEQHRFRVASWDDLRTAFEAAASRPLADFFRQWLTRTGAPALSIREATLRRTDGRNLLQVTIEQREPPYRLRVPIEVSGGGKTAVHYVSVDRGSQTAAFETTFAPDTVRLDPDITLWRQLDASELPPILRQWYIARNAAYGVLSADATFQRQAEELINRLFESRPQKLADASGPLPDKPVMLIGNTTDIDAALMRLKLPPMPANLRGQGSAVVWTITASSGGRPRGAPVAVIAARDAAALEALWRPLPHYGAQSYLVFDGPRMVTRGVWGAEVPAIPVRRIE